MTEPPLFFLVAGEASGDWLGAGLMRALKKRLPAVRFAGIGGPRMQAEGLQLFFAQDEITHFGLVEVLRHLPRLLKRIGQTVAEVKRRRPAALITIDSPDFNFRVARKLKGQGISLIHYVAPTVWVWRARRARKVAQFLDHLLTLLPFEPPYFADEGLAATFVGHPVVESGADRGDGVRFRINHGLAPGTPLLAVLPGSRMGEVARLMPIFRATLTRLRDKHPDLCAVIPAAPGVVAYVKKHSRDWPLPVIVTETDADKYDAFAASHAALACSGTIALELALARVPAVIAYRVNPLTAFLARRLTNFTYANLVNIMHGRMAVPEYLQENCAPDNLAAALETLLGDEAVRQKQVADLEGAAGWLGQGQFVPSERAADTVLRVTGLVERSEAA
ncbi:MAG TPA: lipid-A-disaccharide synthase [Alphaproteobacteria bacterium]|nr:lipid-A-disaccharide synthase [Alphaproteobacteria bacterium]